MVKIKAKKSTVRGEYNGIEDYLRNEYNLKDDVSFKKTKSAGMHGSLNFIWDTPDGEVSCSGYISQPPVATYTMSVIGDENSQSLFGYSLSELYNRKETALTGFEDVE